MSPKPLKRHPSLQPVSRAHHQVLLLGWKIRTGLNKDVPKQRIRLYVEWFYNQYLEAHMKLEEKYLFPFIGLDHPYIVKAMEQHEELSSLLMHDSPDMLSKFEKRLVEHVRFEERVIFEEIQKKTGEESLLEINKFLPEMNFKEREDDIFWK